MNDDLFICFDRTTLPEVYRRALLGFETLLSSVRRYTQLIIELNDLYDRCLNPLCETDPEAETWILTDHDKVEYEQNGLGRRESEHKIKLLAPNLRAALNALPRPPHVTERVILDGGVTGNSHAHALLEIARRIVGPYGPADEASAEIALCDLPSIWLTPDNLMHISTKMPYEFAEAAQQIRSTRQPIISFEDPFRCFEFAEGGRKCKIAPDIQLSHLLSAGTKLAIEAVNTLCAIHFNCDAEDAGHWQFIVRPGTLFHKSARALSCLLQVNVLRDAICEANVDEAIRNGTSAVINLLGIESSSYHGWVCEAMDLVCHAAVWPWTEDGPRSNMIEPRLEVESLHAQRILEKRRPTADVGARNMLVPDAQRALPPTATNVYSPWIDSRKMKEVMKDNAIECRSDSTIGRTKKKWKAESQEGSNHQRFRFRLSTLVELGIKFPDEWNTSPLT